MWLDFKDGWWAFSMDNGELDIETAHDISDWSSEDLIEFFNLPDDDSRFKHIYLFSLRKNPLQEYI